jgi:hypothetical protein
MRIFKILLMVILLLLPIVLSQTSGTKTFTNGLTRGNLSLIDPTNITRWLYIDRFAYIKNNTILFTPFNGTVVVNENYEDGGNGSWSGNPQCNANDWLNTTTGNKLGTHALNFHTHTTGGGCRNQFNYTFPTEVNITRFSYWRTGANDRWKIRLFAGDTPQVWFDVTTTGFWIYNNGTQILVSSNTKADVNYSTITINRTSCTNFTYYLHINNGTYFTNQSLFINDSSACGGFDRLEILSAESGSTQDFILDNFTAYNYWYPNNLRIEIGNPDNTYEWQHIGELRSSNNASVNVTHLESIADSCNCENCSFYKGVRECRVPYLIASDNPTLITYRNITIDYHKTLFLIDERDNKAFDVGNISAARIYADDNSTLIDVQAQPHNGTNLTLGTNKYRVELSYATGDIIVRWIDTNLLSKDIRICANVENVDHFQQLLYAGSPNRAVLMKNLFSNCYVAADYTRFTYQDGFVLQAYTINSNYDILYYDDDVETRLSGLDGSIAAYHNIDNLAFQSEGFDLSILKDALSIQKIDRNTVRIYYENLDEDNVKLNLSITNLNTSVVLNRYTQDDFTDPNEFTLLYNFATQTGITNNTIFKIELITEDENGIISTIKKYFNRQGSAGTLAAGFALTLAIMMVVFGVTFTAVRTAFGWFGILAVVAGWVILGMAVQTWYTLFFQAVCAVCLLYIMTALATSRVRQGQLT